MASLDLILSTVKLVMDKERRYCFDLVMPYVTLTLQAESQVMMNECVSHFAILNYVDG